MEDPRLWASTPFNNQTAWTDFVGRLDLYHRALARRVFAATGKTYRVYPLGDGGGRAWLEAVQSTYRNAAVALGVQAPPDLESYDLKQAGDFASWTFIISQETRRLALAAGLV